MNAAAQRVLDVPLRTGVGADALARGPVAVFWNPGSLGLPSGRGEALVVDARGPTATGLDGVALAGVYRLNDRTAVSGGFLHTGIDDIERTTTSPLPEDGATPIDLSEITFGIAAQRQLAASAAVGAVVRYTRAAEVVGGNDILAFGAGFRLAAPARSGFRPSVGAAAVLDRDGTDWFAGASVEQAIGPSARWVADAEYGVRGSPRFDGLEHRLAVSGTFRERVRVGAGIAVEPGADGRTIEPAGSVSLVISRYVVGLVREQLPNGLGAVHQFRFSVSF